MNEYLKITEEEKSKLLNLIKIIFDEVSSAGGDGDALWYSRFYDINDIKVLIEEFQSQEPYKKRNWKIKFENNTIHWGDNQEWAIITNDVNVFNTSPEFIQMTIRY